MLLISIFHRLGQSSLYGCSEWNKITFIKDKLSSPTLLLLLTYLFLLYSHSHVSVGKRLRISCQNTEILLLELPETVVSFVKNESKG